MNHTESPGEWRLYVANSCQCLELQTPQLKTNHANMRYAVRDALISSILQELNFLSEKFSIQYKSQFFRQLYCDPKKRLATKPKYQH